MEQQRIKMPTGALIACILTVVFVAAVFVGVALLIRNGITGTTLEDVSSTQTPTEITQVAAGTDDEASVITYADNNTSDDSSQTEIISDCMNSVVSIDTLVQSVTAGSGSGVVISSDGYIITCNHVVEGAEEILVYLNDGSEYDATLIGTDSVTDIAVIKVEGSDFAYAEIGSSSSLNVGDGVYAIGNALGVLSNTVTDGIVSGLDREITVEGQSMTLLQTSAAINSGNSGGGLFLESGALIGIVNAKSAGSTIDGLGFAIPIDIAIPVVNDLIEQGFVSGRPFLGVSTQDVSYGAGFFARYTYPMVTSVSAGSAAAIGGIQENDIITSVNGTAVSSGDELRTLIATFSIGDTVTVTVVRGNQTMNISVTLLERTA